MNRPVGFALVTVVVFLALIGFGLLLVGEQNAELSGRASAGEQEAELVYAMEAAVVHTNWELEQKGCSSYENISERFGKFDYQVDFSAPSGSLLDVSVSGTTDHGRQETRWLYAHRSYASSVMTEIVVDTATYIDEAKTTQTKGDDVKIQVTGNPGHDHRALIKADLTAIPASARIDKAELELTVTKAATTADEISVHRITEDWDEDLASWSKRTESNWSTAGGKTSGAVFATFVPTGPAGTKVQVDITSLAREWHAGASNRGLMLSYPLDNGADIHFESDDGVGIRLRVHHSCECGQSCAVDNQITCDANFRPNSLRLEATTNASGHTGIASVSANAQVMGVTFPDGGGFVASAGASLAAYDKQNNPLGTCSPAFDDEVSGLSYVTGGEYAGHLAVLLKNRQVNFIGSSCALSASLNITDSGLDGPTALTYLILPQGAERRNHFLIADEHGNVEVLSPQLAAIESVTLDLPINWAYGLVHVPNQERFLITSGQTDEVYMVALDGTVEQRYDVTRFGREKLGGLTVDLETCDHVLGAMEAGIGSLVFRQPLSMQPLAHWRMDETSGTVAADHIGGHDGAWQGTLEWRPVGGAVQGAIDVDAAEHLLVADDPALRISEAVSISTWIRPRRVDDYHVILSKGTGTQQNYWFGVVFGTPQFLFDDGTYKYEYAPVFLNPGDWHHLAVSYSTVSESIRFYHNGTLVYTAAAGGSLTTGTDPVRIGRSELGGFYEGLIDDLRLFAGELDENDVALLYAEGLPAAGAFIPPADALPPSVCAIQTYADDFESDSFSGDTGTLPWSSDWREVGESDGPYSGDVRLRSSNGNRYVRLRDNNNGGEGVIRKFDMSVFTTATLSFDYAREALGDGHYVSVVVVTSSGEVELGRIERVDGQGTDAIDSFLTSSYSLDAFVDNDELEIKFVTSANMPNTSGMYLDNVTVAGCP